MASSKQSSATSEHKTGDTFEYKGITWKYDAGWKEWQPKRRIRQFHIPTIFMAVSGSWLCGKGGGKTPLAALRNHESNERRSLEAEAASLKKDLGAVLAEIKLLKSKSWLPAPRKPKIAIVSKRLSPKNLTARHYVKGKRK